jgi:hypothetical protein
MSSTASDTLLATSPTPSLTRSTPSAISSFVRSAAQDASSRVLAQLITNFVSAVVGNCLGHCRASLKRRTVSRADVPKRPSRETTSALQPALASSTSVTPRAAERHEAKNAQKHRHDEHDRSCRMTSAIWIVGDQEPHRPAEQKGDQSEVHRCDDLRASFQFAQSRPVDS